MCRLCLLRALQTSAASNPTWLRTPSSRSTNAAFSRTSPIQQRKAIQLRAAAFNLPNHLNPSTPNTSPLSNTTGISAMNVKNFGQITNDISGNNGLNAGDYRIIQMAVNIRILTEAPTLPARMLAGRCRACRRCVHSRS